MTMHEYAFQYSDILGSIDLKIDYLMSPASLDEHGRNLIYVNHFELCAIDLAETSSEWWPFVHCMYSLQNCLNYNTTHEAAEANQTTAKANSAVDDDLEIAGDWTKLHTTECTLTGVAEYCADSTLTSTTYTKLSKCAYSSKGHELAVKSKAKAEAINSGSPLWIKVNNITIEDSMNEKREIDTWATSVKSAICNKIYLGTGEMPSSC